MTVWFTVPALNFLHHQDGYFFAVSVQNFSFDKAERGVAVYINV